MNEKKIIDILYVVVILFHLGQQIPIISEIWHWP